MVFIAFISTALLTFIVGTVLGVYAGYHSALSEYGIDTKKENHKKVKNMSEEELRANIL